MSRPRAVAVAVVLGAVLTGLTACDSDATRARKDAAAAPLAASVQAELSRQPGVRSATVQYADGGINGAGVFVTLVLTPDVDDQQHVDQLGQLTLKAFWLSTVDPLGGVTVQATVSEGSRPEIDATLPADTSQARAALMAMYGPRP